MTEASEPVVYDIAMRTRFRGITRRQGMLLRGPYGWGEWSPFLDYSGTELVPWLRAAREAAEAGFPAPVRDRVPVNCTVAAIGPEQAHRVVTASGCATAKVKVAEPGQRPADDLARVEAVRDALGPAGRIRVDANGAWSTDEAFTALRDLAVFELEYAEQPCRTVPELADLRRRLARAGTNLLIAADESIRRSDDPYRVRDEEAADVAVIKVQPLGGVARCLEIAADIGLPVVVSSALESSVGLAAGIALAAALPELPFACGLNTAPLLTGDVVAEPLAAVDGSIEVRRPEPDPDRLADVRADAETHEFWQARLVQTELINAGPA